MKHIITVNGKPLENLTLAERKELDISIAKAFKKYSQIELKIDESKYIEKRC